MSRVAGLDSDGDWRFGRGRASYLLKADAVQQNVVTRIRSFTDDWFLDIDANIDWLTLLGTRNTRATIEREVERVTLQTTGVARIDNLQSTVSRKDRKITITMQVTTVFGTQFEEEIGVEI
jgi:hypothetical protein